MQDETNFPVYSPFRMVSSEPLRHCGMGAGLHKPQHFQKKAVSSSWYHRNGLSESCSAKQQKGWRNDLRESVYVQLMTVGFKATLYSHLMLVFGSSDTETKDRAVLEVDMSQDFVVLLSFVLPFQPSRTQELKTMPQSCAGRKLSTR